MSKNITAYNQCKIEMQAISMRKQKLKLKISKISILKKKRTKCVFELFTKCLFKIINYKVQCDGKFMVGIFMDKRFIAREKEKKWWKNKIHIKIKSMAQGELFAKPTFISNVEYQCQCSENVVCLIWNHWFRAIFGFGLNAWCSQFLANTSV